MMNYDFCALSDPGMVRGNNEDSVVVDEACRLAILADGMGGYNAGEVASAMTTVYIKSELTRWISQAGSRATVSELTRAVEKSVIEVNASIFNAAASNPLYAGMGTTLVVTVFKGSTLVLCHVGDSRCYRWRRGVLTQLTKDHSVLQEQVDAGFLTSEQAAAAPGKNLLTRALGVEVGVQVTIDQHAVEPDDLYMLCSDGLTDMVKPTEMVELLSSPDTLAAQAHALVARANSNGGRDNVSVILIRSQEAVGKGGLMLKWFGKG